MQQCFAPAAPYLHHRCARLICPSKLTVVIHAILRQSRGRITGGEAHAGVRPMQREAHTGPLSHSEVC